MKKKIMICLFFIITLTTISFIGLIVSITIDQYQDTREWQRTTLAGELRDVPPFLARNYVKADDKEAVTIWNEVAGYLDYADENGGIQEKDWDTCRALLEKSRAKQEEYGLTSGDIQVQNDRLELYLDVESAISTAYETPSAEPLISVTDRLYAMNITVQTPVHAIYFEKLGEIAEDYKNLDAFLFGLLPKLGVIENKTLTVKTEVDPKLTDQLVSEIEKNHLSRFPLVQDLLELLTGNKWAAILRQNEVTRDYRAWEKVKNKLENVYKSSYYPVSSVTTYGQALDMGWDVQVWERDGFTVSPNSPIRTITCKGQAVSPGQYIRYGTPVKATLNEQYVEIPPPEPVVPTPPAVDPGTGWDDWEDWGGDETPDTPPEPPPVETPDVPAGDNPPETSDDPNMGQPENPPETPEVPDEGDSQDDWDGDW